MKPARDPDDATTPLVIGEWQATVEEISIDGRCEEVAARYGVRLDAAPYFLAMERLLEQAARFGDIRLRKAAESAADILRTLQVEDTDDE